MMPGRSAPASPPGSTSFTAGRLWRSLVVPLAIAAPALYWVSEATRRASLETLGRDQGIFQYVAWALTQGEHDYRDIRDVNGLLTPLIHRVFLALGGADEHRFRLLDLLVTGTTFAFAGACLPGVCSRRPPDLLDRAAWGIAAWVTLSAQYLLYGYWDLAQRESFCDWFVLGSVALQLVAQAPWLGARAHDGPARQLRLLAWVGALSLASWFGKPTYALFTVAQIATVWLDRDLLVPRGRALRAFGLGAAACVAVELGLLVAYGDVRAYGRIQLLDVPTMYRFIWPRAAADIFSTAWNATQAIFAIVGAFVLLALVFVRQAPIRLVGVALLPLCALVGVVVQTKAFPYHFHPVTLGVHLQWLVFAAWLAERARTAQRRLALLRLAPVAFGAVVGLRVATSMEDSPHIRAVWLLWGASTPAARETREYFARFPEPDYFPYEMRQTAAYLREHTRPSDRVQVYGMDPYLLFLARRLSATPYIYAYDLNVDAALAGGTGGQPDVEQAERIRALRGAHEEDLVARLDAHPPAAFVFLDTSPLLTEDDAWDDFRTHCATAATWVQGRYRETRRFGHDHVWLRNDIVPADPPADLLVPTESPY